MQVQAWLPSTVGDSMLTNLMALHVEYSFIALTVCLKQVGDRSGLHIRQFGYSRRKGYCNLAFPTSGCEPFWSYRKALNVQSLRFPLTFVNLEGVGAQIAVGFHVLLHLLTS